MPPPVAPARTADATVRRRRVLERFDRSVALERRRLVGSADRDLRRTIVERFLTRQLRGVRGRLLEVGPGPGRFTPLLGGRGRRLYLLDLSPRMLHAARRRLARLGPTRRPAGYLRGAAEGLRMIRPASLEAVVLLGTFGFFGPDVDEALEGIHRALRPGGRLLLEAASPSGALAEVLHARPEIVRRILSRPATHHLWRVLREGYQPYDPKHFAVWEFGFWRGSGLLPLLERHGFAVRERLSVAPISGNQPAVLARLRRDRRAWRTLLTVEEELGHWEELLGAGPVWLIAAQRVRTAKSRPSQRSAAGQ